MLKPLVGNTILANDVMGSSCACIGRNVLLAIEEKKTRGNRKKAERSMVTDVKTKAWKTFFLKKSHATNTTVHEAP